MVMIDRKELHRLVDQLPEDKLPRMSDLFYHLFDEDEEFSDETKREIKEGLEAYQRGEYVTLDEHLKSVDSTDV